AGPRQVRAAVCGVVHTDYDLPRKQVLKSEIPHVDLGIARRYGVQIARVAESPLSERAVFGSLRRRQTPGKWAGVGAIGLCWGGPKASKLVLEIILGEEHVRGFGECRTGILEVGRYVHAIKDSRTTTYYRIGGKLISKAKARSPVISIHRGIASARRWKDTRASDLANLTKLGEGSRLITVEWNADSRVSSEVVELEPVESLGVWSAPLVSQPEIERQFRCSFPIVLHEKCSFFRFISYGWHEV